MPEQKKKSTTGLSAVQAVPIGIKVIKKGEPIPEPEDLPVKDMPAYETIIKEPEDHQTIADKLDYLCDQLGAKHYRELVQLDSGETGDVILKLKLEDGTVLAGKGATTAEAFNALLPKVQLFASATAKETK